MDVPLKVVLFDLGGVLIELDGPPKPLTALADRLTPAQMWAHWHASPAVRAFESGQIDASTFARRLIAEVDLPLGPDDVLASLAQWPKGLSPGALELLDRLATKCQRAIFSNCNALHWPRYIETWGLGQRVDAAFSSHFVGVMKPEPAAFQRVLRALGCAPAAVLFLDDHGPNVEAARQLGLRAEQVRGLAEVEAALARWGVLEGGAQGGADPAQ